MQVGRANGLAILADARFGRFSKNPSLDRKQIETIVSCYLSSHATNCEIFLNGQIGENAVAPAG